MMHQTTTPTASFDTNAQAAAPSRSLLRTLGIAGMIGSPFLAVSMLIQGSGEQYVPGGIGSVLGLVFVVGWYANVLGMWLLRVTGRNVAARVPLALALVTVLFAGAFQIYEVVAPRSESIFYSITDLSWPLSMVLTLITGIIAAIVGVLRGWTRFVPLACGLWLPVGMLLKVAGLNEQTGILVTGLHSTVAWFLLGLVIYNAGRANGR